jgi:hypothetical protein
MRIRDNRNEINLFNFVTQTEVLNPDLKIRFDCFRNTDAVLCALSH